MKDKEIKVGDWVVVTKVGLTERYMVESIEDDFYIVVGWISVSLWLGMVRNG